MKIGTSRLAGLASSASFSGSTTYVDNAMIPASRSAWRTPVCSAITPPCENPAMTMRRASMPLAFSRAMSASTCACDSRTPATSARLVMSPAERSYQARIRNPLLSVTGRTGACGKTKRIGSAAGSRISPTIGTKSLPSAPRPWSQITAAVGCGPVSCSTQGNTSAVMVNLRATRLGALGLGTDPARSWAGCWRVGPRILLRAADDAHRCPLKPCPPPYQPGRTKRCLPPSQPNAFPWARILVRARSSIDIGLSDLLPTVGFFQRPTRCPMPSLPARPHSPIPYSRRCHRATPRASAKPANPPS